MLKIYAKKSLQFQDCFKAKISSETIQLIFCKAEALGKGMIATK